MPRPVIQTKLTRVQQAAALKALADDPDFDADRYKKGDVGRAYRMHCEICNTRHALCGLCGYCYGAVKMIRAASGPRIYVEPQLPKEEEDADIS